MDGFTAWWEAFLETLSGALQGIGGYLPLAAAALAVMAIGWLVARILRAVALRSGTALNRGLARVGQSASSRSLKLSETALALIGNLLFWAVILLFAAVAARVAGLEAFSNWLDRIVDYLPTLIAGVLIALAGFLLSTLLRDIVSAAVSSTGSAQGRPAGLAVQVAVLATAIVIGLDQIGINVTFLMILVAVFLGGALLSVALAFGFGSRDFVANLIAAQELKRMLEPGERTRIGDIEGRVVEVTATAVLLVNVEGRQIVPAAMFLQRASVMLAGEADE